MKSKLIILALLAMSMTACDSLAALGVEPDENAVGCLVGNSSGASGILNGGVRGVTAEVGKTDTTDWTAADWKELLEVCTVSTGV